MTIKLLRGILCTMLRASSRDARTARKDGRYRQAEYAEVEVALLIRILGIIDNAPGAA